MEQRWLPATRSPRDLAEREAAEVPSWVSQAGDAAKGFDAVRRQLSPTGKVEAAGIEPASRDISMKASTRVVDSFKLSTSQPQSTGSSQRSQKLYLTPSVPDMTRGGPDLATDFCNYSG